MNTIKICAKSRRLPMWAGLVALLALLCLITPLQADIFQNKLLYVDVNASGANNGASWADAYTSLQDALAIAQGDATIFVASGVYYPDVGGGRVGDDQFASFELKSGVAIYGGFAGSESSLDERDVTANLTVLSGDIDQNDVNDDGNFIAESWEDLVGQNSFHVVSAYTASVTAILDGFTITGGSADLSPSNSNPFNFGGGLYNSGGSPTLRNLTFSGNRAVSGGGMYNESGWDSNSTGDSRPSLDNIIFSGNLATNDGGGMFNRGCSIQLSAASLRGRPPGGPDEPPCPSSNAQLTHVIFRGNRALQNGGGMYSDWSSPKLYNVTFVENQARSGGGLTIAWSAEFTLINGIISGNVATNYGGGVLNGPGSPKFINVLISGNRALWGGGLANSSSGPRLTNVTISGNKADQGGGAMVNDGEPSPTMANMIIWGNDAPDGEQIAGGASDIRNTVIQGSQGSGQSWSSTLITNGNDSLDADPRFVAPVAASHAPTTSGNYRLLADSPAIDAGYDFANNVPVDLDGNPRITGQAIDLGPYESSGAPNVLINPLNLSISEPDGVGIFAVKLATQPTATVTIHFSTSDTSQCTVPAAVNLDASTWQDGAEITVSAVDDAVADGAQLCMIHTSVTSSDPSYNEIPVRDIAVMVHDDDVAGFMVNPSNLMISEPAGTGVFTITLTSQPMAAVTVHLAQNDLGRCSTPATAEIDSNTWQIGVPVFVLAVDDDLASGDQTCTIALTTTSADPLYDGLTAGPVVVTVQDDDQAPVPEARLIVAQSSNVTTAIIGETTINYTYHLTNTGNVSLTVELVDDLLGPIALALLPESTDRTPLVVLEAGQTAVGELAYLPQFHDLPGPVRNTVTVTGTGAAGSVVTASAGTAVELLVRTQAQTIYLGQDLALVIGAGSTAAGAPVDIIVIPGVAPAHLFLRGVAHHTPYTTLSSLVELTNQLLTGDCEPGTLCQAVTRLVFDGSGSSFYIEMITDLEVVTVHHLPLMLRQ
jgi:hypothetical protein